jgi:hypothetical protein
MSHLLIPDGPRCVTSHPNTYHTLNISPLQGAATEKPLLSGSRKLLMCAVGLALGVCAFAWGVWLSPKVHEMLVLRTANVARARPFVSQRNALETEAVSKYAVETRLMHSMPQHIYTTPKLEWFRVDHIQSMLSTPFRTLGLALISCAAIRLIWSAFGSRKKLAMLATTATKEEDQSFGVKKQALKECLRREYASLFDPFERQFYTPDVSFADPMTSFTGMEKYQSNVDMLAARTPLGKLLFSNASIQMFSVEDMGEKGLRTRWMLRLCAKILPWKPVARFTGVSEYKLDDDCKVVAQQDYWDSINLVNGRYEPQSVLTGVADFLGQLAPEQKAVSAMGAELPYLLLRRAKYYSVRQYPKRTVVKTVYQRRPEAYDRLGRYSRDAEVAPMVPALFRIPKEGDGEKTMEWPLNFAMPNRPQLEAVPAPEFDSIEVAEEDSFVVAVYEFPEEATPKNVEANAAFLEKIVERDGLKVSQYSKDKFMVAQYNAIFSLATRRNEVWCILDGHDWE